MHDPLVVAHEIRRPWPQRSSLPAAGHRDTRWKIRLHHDHLPSCADDPPHPEGAFPWWKPSSYTAFWRLAGRDYYWPPLITIWHREPDARDALTVCERSVQQPDGTWRRIGHWRWHIHHWHIQIHPLQNARRHLLTRCTWCGGRDRKGDRVNFSQSWDGPRGRWWQGERGLYHSYCASVERAHQTCLCTSPVLDHTGYGQCRTCRLFRPWGLERDPAQVARLREYAALPVGGRPLKTDTPTERTVDR